MINNLKTISRNKLKAQIDYLRNTPVRQFADLLESGACVLKTVIITDIKSLGNQMTIFGDLGGILAKNIYNQDKFFVNQVWSILNREDCSDSKSRDAVSGIMKALEDQTLTPNITIYRTNEDMIIDGNKTLTAFYELHKNTKAPISLSVFVIFPDDHHDLR